MDHCCTFDDYSTEIPPANFLPLQMAALPPVIPERDALRPGGCTSYGRRSISSHCLNKKNMEVYYSSSVSPPGTNFERSVSVMKALSSGDLEGVNFVQHTPRLSSSSSPLANENSSILESMNRASPYSWEEKKERIERYRSKRNLRNFNKKIKYECRKTLADNRPRIRGRFARNDETEKANQIQWDHRAGNEEEDNWRKFIDSFQAQLMP